MRAAEEASSVRSLFDESLKPSAFRSFNESSSPGENPPGGPIKQEICFAGSSFFEISGILKPFLSANIMGFREFFKVSSKGVTFDSLGNHAICDCFAAEIIFRFIRSAYLTHFPRHHFF